MVFLKLTLSNGMPILINKNQIERIEPNDDDSEGCAIFTLTKFIPVKDTFKQVIELLHSPGFENPAVKEGLDYNLEYVDSEIIKLHRSR